MEKKWNKEDRHPSLAILSGDCKISQSTSCL